MGKNSQKVLVIGGGPAGIEAALRIGQAGLQALLVERENTLGGNLNRLYRSFPRWENPEELLKYKLTELRSLPQVRVLTSTKVISSRRKENGFEVHLQEANGRSWQEEVAAVILATGFELLDASCYGEYGYGIYPHVVSALEFEIQLRDWAENRGAIRPKSVAFFACVGSRDRSKGYPYCSKICCMYIAKQAGIVKELFPDARCYVFYMDYRAAGKEYEEFVRSVIENRRVRYIRGRPAKVLKDEGGLLVRAEDTLIGVPVEVTVDWVVLASAIVPGKDTVGLATMFGASTDEYGFLESRTLGSLQAGDRVFFAGACGFATEIVGAIQQGAAAAAEVIAMLRADEGGR